MRKNLIAKSAMSLIALSIFCLQACNNSSTTEVAADSTTLKQDPSEESKAVDTVSATAHVDSVVAATPPPSTTKIEETKSPGKTEKLPAKKDESKAEAEKPAAAPQVDNASIEAGKNLLATSDCLTCHKIQEKAIGPAYADIAKKYPDTEANVQLLASKIINGGSGVWGQIPMTPHPSLQQDDVKKMVKYILSLN